MKRNKLTFIIFCLSIIQLCSCNEQISSDANSLDFDKKSTDTIIKDIPSDKKVASYQLIKSNIEKKIGLSSLESGFDGLQIRLWYGYAFQDKEQLIIFKDSNSKWSAELYTLTYQFNDKYDTILSIEKEVVVREPKSGWKYFTNRLIELNILTLKDYHSIPGYYSSTDGNGITVEVATKNKYRIYSYTDPAAYQSRIKEAKNMEKIMELIEQEFDFERLSKF